MKDHLPSTHPKYLAVLLILISIFLVYMNTFQASWQLDDFPNILDNVNLHLQDLSCSSIKKTFYSSFEEQASLYRPVSGLSFALNWYFGKDSVQGFHAVNLTLHFFTASILFLTIIQLFQSPRLINQFSGHPVDIALISTLLWALNPIQIQAVTYIVQRMALLAALFSITGIYFYIRARLMPFSFTRLFMFLLCFLSFLLSLGSKENAAMMPLSMFLFEICFFQNFPISNTKKKYVLVSLLGLILCFACITIFLEKERFLILLNGYEHRPFNLLQRLMTSPRIIFFYLGQIFYPIPSQFSIVHDITVSTSWFQPWTTLYSMIGIGLLICASFLLFQKFRLLSFAILFFLTNHFIESSFLPLELIFEHRNYLPSLFLFLPVGAYLISAHNHYHAKKHFFHGILILLIVLMIIGSGVSTYTRNKAWQTEASLWKDAMLKYPGLASPRQKMAAFYQSQNQIDRSKKLYLESLTLNSQRPKQSIVLALNNLGNIYFQRQDYVNAIEFYKNVLKIYPKNERAIYNLALAHIKQEKWDLASENIDMLISIHPHHAQYRNTKGFILFKQQHHEKALHHLRKALHYSPFNPSVKINIGAVLSLMGHHARAEWFLNKAEKESPDDIFILLCLIENSIRSGDNIKSDDYLEKLFSRFPVKAIVHQIDILVHDHTTSPVSIKLVLPVIEKKLLCLSHKMTKLSRDKN
jgi:tetratricopeptide (TPR) repeat protein